MTQTIRQRETLQSQIIAEKSRRLQFRLSVWERIGWLIEYIFRGFK